MKPRTVLIMVALLLAAQVLLASSVPVFQHDPVQENRYFHEHILPRLIAFGVILAVAVAMFLAVRKFGRKASKKK